MHLICFGRILRPSHGNLGVWLRPGADSEGGDADSEARFIKMLTNTAGFSLPTSEVWSLVKV